MPSTFNLITGIPNHGKSNFLDQILMNLAENENWSFAIFSPEHSTPNHIRRLLEKRCRKPFDIGINTRINQEELNNGIEFLDNHFRFIENTEEIPNIEFILTKAKLAKRRFGVKGLVIDPFNQVSPDRDYAKREDGWLHTLINYIGMIVALFHHLIYIKLVVQHIGQIWLMLAWLFIEILNKIRLKLLQGK